VPCHNRNRGFFIVSPRELSRLATAIENGEPLPADLPEGEGLVVGITGPPGAGKSTLTAAIIQSLRERGKRVAVVAVDPSSRATGGAVLGDRVRMQQHHADPDVFIRSMATRGAHGGLAKTSGTLARLFRGAGFHFVLLETVGVGQDEIEIAATADFTIVVVVPGMGDDVQAIKAGVLEIADIFVINKADRPGAEHTQMELEGMLSMTEELKPIFRTVATESTGVDELVEHLLTLRRPERTDAAQIRGIDHLAIAVRSLDEALPFYVDQLGLHATSRETVPHEKVTVAMLPLGDTRLELLEALDATSTIARFIDKRGPGLHHVALRVANLTALAATLQAAGIRLLAEPQKGAGGHLYVFLHPADTGGVLWELIQD
jgi:LAO/AO transport system kinase